MADLCYFYEKCWEEIKMAMIQCPNCGKDVSDKAQKCVHCGYTLKETPPPVCPECGTELEEGATVCKNCGCPITSAMEPVVAIDIPQKVEVAKVSVIPQVSRKKILIFAVAGLVFICAVFGIRAIIHQQAEKEYQNLVQNYGVNLENTVETMLSGAADAESCGNLIIKVWNNSIFEENDSETDKYTVKSRSSTWMGYNYDFYDFNTALSNLFSDDDFSSKIDEIAENQETVSAMMKELQNPPEEWENAYNDLQDFYDAYLSLTNMAINPTGSLQTFSSGFREADAETVNCYNKMQTYFN